jgi:hypothetical protein
MNVFSLEADANNYQNLVLVRDEDWNELTDWFKGQPIGTSWRPIAVRVLRDRSHKDRPPSDFPSLGGTIPVFSKHAIEVLADLLEKNGEILPLECEEGTYFAFNATCVLNALDMEKSEFEYFRSSGRIMRIVRYDFVPEGLVGATIFKLEQVPEGSGVVTFGRYSPGDQSIGLFWVWRGLV